MDVTNPLRTFPQGTERCQWRYCTVYCRWTRKDVKTLRQAGVDMWLPLEGSETTCARATELSLFTRLPSPPYVEFRTSSLPPLFLCLSFFLSLSDPQVNPDKKTNFLYPLKGSYKKTQVYGFLKEHSIAFDGRFIHEIHYNNLMNF